MGMGGQLHAPAALPQGKRSGTHFIGGWVRPRAGLSYIIVLNYSAVVGIYIVPGICFLLAILSLHTSLCL
jgi:hypothetical protein